MDFLDTPMVFLTTGSPEASRRFYEDLLGLEFVADEPWALVFRAGPCTLRIQKAERLLPEARYTVLGWRVDDIRHSVTRLRERGLVFERYDGMDQDEDGVWTSPGGSKVAWFTDPDGNTLSLTEN